MQKRATKNIVANAKKQDANLVIIEKKAAVYKKNMLAELTTPTLLGNSPLVVIEEAENCTDELIEDIVKLVENIINGKKLAAEIIIQHSGAVRGKKMVNTLEKAQSPGIKVILAEELKRDSDKIAFVGAEFRACGKGVANDAALAVVQYAGENVEAMVAYISQLANDLADNVSTVTKKQVDEFFNGLLQVSAWDIVNAAVAGDEYKAVALLRHALEKGETVHSIIPAVVVKLKQIAKVSALKTKGLSLKDIGMQEWQVRNTQQEINKISGGSEQIIQTFNALLEADMASKGDSPDGGLFATELALRTLARR